MSIFYIRYSGPLPGGEQWNSGVHVSSATDLSSVLDAASDAASELWGAGGVAPIGGYYPSSVQLTSAVVYQLDEDTGKATARAEATLAHAGTAVDTPLPQEVAVCCTLRTPSPGPAGRGRMYLPGTGTATVTALGRLDSTVRDGIADSLAAALGVLVAASAFPVLFTVGRPNRSITAVDVGDVFDAQRRRRDKLIEARTSVTV